MIMIVFHHFAVHGGFKWGSTSPFMITRLWYNFIIMGGKIGVDVFVLISGYYLINDDRRIFNLKKVIKFLGQVVFYSIVIFIISGMAGFRDIGVKSFVKACFPITFSQWWFASAYFVLYLMHPFLNKFLHNIDKTLYQKLILLLVTCWSVIPTFTTSLYQSNSLLWFVTLYAISGYIRLYGLNKKFTAKDYFIFGLVCSILTYMSRVIFTMLGSKWAFFSSHAAHFYEKERITVLFISLCLFMIFAELKMNYHKWINTVASTTFGIYLIHDHRIIRPWLWIELFKNAQYQDSLFLIPYSIMVVAIVMCVCSLIDLLRQHIIEKPFMKIVGRYSEKMITPLESGITLLNDFVFGREN